MRPGKGLWDEGEIGHEAFQNYVPTCLVPVAFKQRMNEPERHSSYVHAVTSNPIQTVLRA